MKLYQCGFSSFIYELFRNNDGTVRATKTSVRSGALCLEKTFDSEDEGKKWIVERSDLDQKFILAYRKLAGKSDD